MAVRDLIISTGQSNSDPSSEANMLTLMTSKGLSNPAYIEGLFNGSVFRNWQTSGGAARYVTGVDLSPENIISIERVAAVATVTFDSSHPYQVKAPIVISSPSIYAGTYTVRQDTGSTTITINVGSEADEGDVGATARYRGIAETDGVYEQGIQDIIDGGDTVNIIQFQFMQGEGNATATPGNGEYDYFPGFLAYMSNYIRTTLGGMSGVSIDSNFCTSVGLTALQHSAITDPLVLGGLRTKQVNAADAASSTFWVESLQLPRAGDGVHMEDPDELKSRQIDTYFEQANKPAPVPQYGFD